MSDGSYNLKKCRGLRRDLSRGETTTSMIEKRTAENSSISATTARSVVVRAKNVKKLCATAEAR